MLSVCYFFFFFQAEDGIRDIGVTGVQTCALPIWSRGTFFFPGKKKVPRDLHRDRRSPLSLAAAYQVGVGCPEHPVVVDPGMLVKALVLGREDGLFHQRRNLLDADDRTALFAELPDQQAVGGVDA